MERPKTLQLDGSGSSKNTPSPSPTDGAAKKWPESLADSVEKYEEIKEYIKEVDELLQFLKPFPRTSKVESLRPSLDHLENLIRLVEQLKDLKERNIQSQLRTQHLKESRKLRERRRKVQDETKDGEKNIPPPPPDPTKKHRPSIAFRKSSRSKSIISNDYEKLFASDERISSSRKSLTPIKSKVSKWTKVKEAFRWEKASLLENRLKYVKPEKKSDVHWPLEVTIAEEAVLETPISLKNRLQVPCERPGDSPSPADSVLSGHLSSCSSLGAASSSYLMPSSGYYGEHSSTGQSSSSVCLTDLPPSQSRALYKEASLSMSLQNLSSSSDDEEMLNLSAIGSREGISCGVHQVSDDNIETRRSKSLDGETVLGPHPYLLQHSSKESLTESSKLQKHKTPWGLVKDIIQTRKDSVKKKSKKRTDFMIDSDVSLEKQGSDDLPSPDETAKDKRPKIEVTFDGSPELSSCTSPYKSEGMLDRPFTPVLTLTMPSTEQLQDIAVAENEDGPQSSPLPDDLNKFAEFEEKGGNSRWCKVKKAFMTSAMSPRTEDGGLQSGSAPSSPFHLGSFFSDIESDELSSGDWTEERHGYDNIAESPTTSGLSTAFLQAEVQRNYCELQKKLAKDLEENMQACEMVKSLSKSVEKTKDEDFDKIPTKPRESLAVTLPNVDDLSPEFKKKLDEWKKIKKAPAAVVVPKEEPQTHFISKIGEWQRWRPGSGSHKPDTHLKEHHFQEDFYKKIEEWQMLKGGKRRSRSHSDRGKEDETPSPGLSRKNSKGKKIGSGKSSVSDSLSAGLKDGRGERKSQKEKDLQWLEKELQKIEREKIRLEREREKYLERQQRLERMKRTMDTTSPTQEVLIQTATGFFRFQGISQKFTKKLYEWEKARGIAPEASTFALLETASVANRGSARGTARGLPRDDRPSLQRSKSVGSVIDSSSMVSQSIANHPSSLSLNDVHDLEALEQTNLLEASLASLDPGLDANDDEEPEALIVDVEDVEEETAALMADEPHVLGEVPIYSYAPAEVTQLIDSSSSDGEKEVQVLEAITVGENTKAEKENIMDENIHLLQRLQLEENICRGIESDLVDIEDKMSDGEKEFTPDSPPRVDLLEEEKNLQHSLLRHSKEEEELAHNLLDNLRLLHKVNTPPSYHNVKDVYDMSSELLSLAQTLENALRDRNMEIKNAPSCYERRTRPNKLGSGKAWYSTEEGSLDEPISGSRFRGEDDSVENITSMIKMKVMNMKESLSRLQRTPDKETAQLEKPRKLSSSRETSEENETSFTVQFTKSSSSNTRPSISSIVEESAKPLSQKRPSLKMVALPSSQQDNLSPVTVTLVSPPFWSKIEKNEEPRLEKSKTQLMFSREAENVFDSNLKVREQENAFEKKSPEVLKRRIKEKISEMQRLTSEVRTRVPTVPSSIRKEDEAKSIDDAGQIDSNVVVVKKKVSSKKILKTRRITDSNVAYMCPNKEDDGDDVFVGSGEEICRYQEVPSPGLPGDTPSFVFVPTSRKIISPVERDVSSSVISYVIDDIETKDELKKADPVKEDQRLGDVLPPEKTPSAKPLTKVSSDKKISSDIGIPPLPNSPSTTKKLFHKDVSSPTIRMMIAKFSQKGNEDVKEATCGTSVPPSWKSPVLERRVKEQLQKFQEQGDDALKHGGKFRRGEVQKSASAGYITSKKDDANPEVARRPETDQGKQLRGVLKSSSTGNMKNSKAETNKKEQSIVEPDSQQTPPCPPSAVRAMQIKQAKEEFLSRGPGGQSWTSDVAGTPTSLVPGFCWRTPVQREDSASMEMKLRNRSSHISVGSESSFDETSYDDEFSQLIKSASAGMISCDKDGVSRRCSEGGTLKGGPLIPHSATDHTVHTKGSKFGISTLKSKFRKVKMRRGKEKEGAVSALCRQSLMLDVSKTGKDVESKPSTSKSCPSSPVFDRTKRKAEDAKKWMKNTAKLFKSKESKNSSTSSLNDPRGSETK